MTMTIIVEPLDLGGSGPRVAIKDTIDVAGTATRAEMAAILMRFTESHN